MEVPVYVIEWLQEWGFIVAICLIVAVAITWKKINEKNKQKEAVELVKNTPLPHEHKLPDTLPVPGNMQIKELPEFTAGLDAEGDVVETAEHQMVVLNDMLKKTKMASAKEMKKSLQSIVKEERELYTQNQNLIKRKKELVTVRQRLEKALSMMGEKV